MQDVSEQFREREAGVLQGLNGKLGYPELSLANARHTFASVLNENNVPIQHISELLGHKSILTTQIYLSSLSTSKLVDISDKYAVKLKEVSMYEDIATIMLSHYSPDAKRYEVTIVDNEFQVGPEIKFERKKKKGS